MKYHLGNGKFVYVNYFKERLYVHIRVFDKKVPTKKGIAMMPTRFASFLQSFAGLDEAFEGVLRGDKGVDLMKHIGGGVYGVVKSGSFCVNLRRYWKPDSSTDQLSPTKQGVALNKDEWRKLKTIMPKIEKLDPLLENCRPCNESLDHCNQMGFLSCIECNPFYQEELRNYF